jgi:hypothetical protein
MLVRIKLIKARGADDARVLFCWLFWARFCDGRTAAFAVSLTTAALRLAALRKFRTLKSVPVYYHRSLSMGRGEVFSHALHRPKHRLETL